MSSEVIQHIPEIAHQSQYLIPMALGFLGTAFGAVYINLPQKSKEIIKGRGVEANEQPEKISDRLIKVPTGGAGGVRLDDETIIYVEDHRPRRGKIAKFRAWMTQSEIRTNKTGEADHSVIFKTPQGEVLLTHKTEEKNGKPRSHTKKGLRLPKRNRRRDGAGDW